MFLHFQEVVCHQMLSGKCCAGWYAEGLVNNVKQSQKVFFDDKDIVTKMGIKYGCPGQCTGIQKSLYQKLLKITFVDMEFYLSFHLMRRIYCVLCSCSHPLGRLFGTYMIFPKGEALLNGRWNRVREEGQGNQCSYEMNS